MKPTKHQLSADAAQLVVYKLQADTHILVNTSAILPKHPTAKLPTFVGSEIRIGKLLGTGSFSRVYEIKAVDLLLTTSWDKKRSVLSDKALQLIKGNSPLVAKHMRGKFVTDPRRFRDNARDLLMEANYLATLRHPHIIRVRGVAAGGANAYLSGRHNSFFTIMDRIECTLADRIEQWSLELKKLTPAMLGKMGNQLGSASTDEVLFAGRLKIIRDVASAVKYLHSHRLIHRDLKPKNVGFDAFGKVKLFDFGLIYEMDKDQRSLTIRAGTPRYMAPECYVGTHYDRSADIYSLTITLWECLALQMCFNTLGHEAHQLAVIEGGERPPLDESWPSNVQDLMQRGWQQDRMKRPTIKQFHRGMVNAIEELKKPPPSDCDESEKDSHSTAESTRSGWMKEIVHMMYYRPH